MPFQTPVGIPFSLESANTGALFTRNASGLWVPLNPGSNGQVLTIAGNVPTWADPTVSQNRPVVSVSSNKTFSLSDANSIQHCVNSTATDITLTIPNDTTANLPIGCTIDVVIELGLVSLAVESGVTFDNQTPVGVRRWSAQFSSYVLFKLGPNRWVARNYTFRPSLNTIIPRVDLMTLQPASVVVSGAGATVTPNNSGFVQITTGASTTGRAHLGGVPTPGGVNLDFFDIAGRCVYFACNASVSALSDATNTFFARAGLASNLSSPTPNAGFYLSHSTANSGNWQVVARNNNLETVLNTSIPATTATLFEFVIKNNVGQVFINGSDFGTISTNIPSGASNSVNVAFGSIIKTLGTTARILSVNTLSICRWL